MMRVSWTKMIRNGCTERGRKLLEPRCNPLERPALAGDEDYRERMSSLTEVRRMQLQAGCLHKRFRRQEGEGDQVVLVSSCLRFVSRARSVSQNVVPYDPLHDIFSVTQRKPVP